MSALLKETQALINSVISKTKDLETDIIRLQKQFDMAGSLPPYVQVELNSDRNSRAVVISRNFLMTCQTMTEFYDILTNILNLPGLRYFAPPKPGITYTRESLGHVPMKVLAIFDPANKSPINEDWCQIAEWDESLVDILKVVTKLKVVALKPQD